MDVNRQVEAPVSAELFPEFLIGMIDCVNTMLAFTIKADRAHGADFVLFRGRIVELVKVEHDVITHVEQRTDQRFFTVFNTKEKRGETARLRLSTLHFFVKYCHWIVEIDYHV